MHQRTHTSSAPSLSPMTPGALPGEVNKVVLHDAVLNIAIVWNETRAKSGGEG